MTEFLEFGSDADMDLRPRDKGEYRKLQAKLHALKKAWSALDDDVQWHLVCGVNTMFKDEADDHLPNIAPLVDALIDEMKKPTGAPIQIDGLSPVVEFLWSVRCRQELGGYVPLEPAIEPIAAEVSRTFLLSQEEARRRVGHMLRRLEKQGWLPRRPTARDEVKGRG
ncbi:hypothetical protein [Sphingomonas gilva]|nr:hypothetical protein [Sphingomonas gilva]